MAWASFTGVAKRLDAFLIDQRYADQRPATDEDVSGWFDAADRRAGARTKKQIIERLERKNNYRWWRLKRDYKWLQKEFKKMGLNPEDAKELL